MNIRSSSDGVNVGNMNTIVSVIQNTTMPTLHLYNCKLI